jgi:hypothetical protein
MATADGAVPNLPIIGATKLGTSSLADDLRDHPDVFTSRANELRCFTDRRD